MRAACRRAQYSLRQVNFSQHGNERGIDFFLHWCTLSVAGEFSLGRHSVKKILITLLLAATPLVALASQEVVQPTPDTGSKAANSHHARRHHKRSRNSHHVKHHRATKQHSQTQ